MTQRNRDMGDYGPTPHLRGSEWDYLEPTHLVGAFVAAGALSLLWSIVCLIASAVLWGAPWGALLGPVVGTAHAFLSLREHLRAQHRAFRNIP